VSEPPDGDALAAAAAHAVKPPRPTSPATQHVATQGNEEDDPDASEVPIQSGRTVPLSAAMLADVVRSVDQKRAATAASAAARVAPAALEPPPAVDVPSPPRRSALALTVILLLGVGIFVVGVAMFLDAMR
jgi:hypothetical protein